MKIYYILDENGYYISHNYYTTAPEGNVTDVLMKETFTKPQFLNGEWVEGGEPVKQEVPNEVTLWSLKIVLHEMGLLESVEYALSQLEEPIKSRASFIWEYGNTADRDSFTVGMLGQILSKTDEEIDEIFITANNIKL